MKPWNDGNVDGHADKSDRPWHCRQAETSLPIAEDDSDAIGPADDDMPMPEMQTMKSFHMHEEEKVVAFLYSRIAGLQQLADKKIAKAWIKAICPRKQAKFPYRDKKRVKAIGEEPVVPGWWPDVEKCPFTEPDHVKKERQFS